MTHPQESSNPASARLTSAEPDDETFRRELRAWLAAHLVGEFASIPGIGFASDDRYPSIRIAWEKELVKGGWLGLTWPVEYGGRGFGINKEIILLEEVTRARAPKWFGGPGRDLLAPMLLQFGTPAQKQRFLPSIMHVEELWGQGFSEPGAGSDLASVRTRAERRDGRWVINGQKIWMTFGNSADWMFLLCRTDPDAPKHRGLTMLLVDAHQPGVSTRPIRTMIGTSEFAEVFFTDAVTNDDLVLGTLNEGWRVAMNTVTWERALTALPYEINFEHQFMQLVEHVRASGKSTDPVVRDRMAQSWISLRALRCNTQRMLDHLHVHGELPMSSSVSKLLWASWHQEFGQLAAELAGTESLFVGPDYDLTPFQDILLGSRAETIYGGSHEIQKNIISERVLGLPR
jgi:alkylation response protein AidB-like acyl-CoA dehydrogenase